MKNKLTHNLGLKFISLLMAVGIWLIIIYTYDPASTAEFTLDVKILNADAITSLNQVYEVIEGDTVTIRVKGKTSLVKSLKASDFLATADISKLSPTMHASIDVVCTKSNGVEITFLGKVNMLAIRLEDVAQKQFKITVVPEGTVADGYYVGTSTTKPNLIQVSGAKSAVERISEVRVSVDVTAATESLVTDGELKAYDVNGKEIKTGSLTFSKNPVSVYTTIYGTKEVPIEIETEGEAYSGYRLTGIEYEPKSVSVAGSAEALAKVDKIPIPVSIANRITSLEETLQLSEFMPENVFLTDPNASVNVYVAIERLIVKAYELPYENIQLRGTNPEWDYSLVQEGNFTVRIMGLQEELDGLETVSLRPYVELSGSEAEGEYSLVIQFELEERFEVANPPSATVQVREKPGEPPDGGGDEDGGGDDDSGTGGDGTGGTGTGGDGTDSGSDGDGTDGGGTDGGGTGGDEGTGGSAEGGNGSEGEGTAGEGSAGDGRDGTAGEDGSGTDSPDGSEDGAGSGGGGESNADSGGDAQGEGNT